MTWDPPSSIKVLQALTGTIVGGLLITQIGISKNRAKYWLSTHLNAVPAAERPRKWAYLEVGRLPSEPPVDWRLRLAGAAIGIVVGGLAQLLTYGVTAGGLIAYRWVLGYSPDIAMLEATCVATSILCAVFAGQLATRELHRRGVEFPS